MESLPFYISIVFMATALLTLMFLYKAARQSKTIVVICLVWLALQAVIGLSGFYKVTNTMPPRFVLTILPPLSAIALCFLTKRGRSFLDSLNIKWLTLLHIVRLLVEMVLLWLFLHKYVPQLMTFEGRNFDVFSGLSAPFIFYFGYIKKTLNRNLFLAWNFICLLLLLNVFVNAILSAPFPFQQFAFDQPNIAVLYFPFVWLPCFIVPVVLLAHLVSIRQWLKQNKEAIHYVDNKPFYF